MDARERSGHGDMELLPRGVRAQAVLMHRYARQPGALRTALFRVFTAVSLRGHDPSVTVHWCSKSTPGPSGLPGGRGVGPREPVLQSHAWSFWSDQTLPRNYLRPGMSHLVGINSDKTWSKRAP